MERFRRLIARCHRGHLTLRTRILLVVFSVAAASTLLTVLLQDKSLARDLEQATRARLERAHGTVSQLLADHLVAQVRRYRAIASTPQFIANLESRHQPTLAHFATELLGEHDATAILILDSNDDELAGSGSKRLRAMIGADLASKTANSGPALSGSRTATTVTYHGIPYSLVCVALRDGSKNLGSLVGLEQITSDLLSSWSRLSRAEVLTSEPDDEDSLALAINSTGGAALFVQTSFDVERQALANSRSNLLAGGLLSLGLALFASIFLARSLVSPIRAIQSGIARIGSGDRRFRFETDRVDEVGDVARGLNDMLDRLEESVAERIHVQDQISRLSYHDTLTGLGNRRMLTERFDSELDRNSSASVAVIFLDLDRFKDINDTLGHTAGDELLVEVAKRLDSCLRMIEPPGCHGNEVGLLARIGGDEFTLLLSHIEDSDAIEALATDILDALASPFELCGRQITLSASLGIAMAPSNTADVETLLRNSDLAMFQAKNRGGKGYAFYSDSLLETATKRLSLDRRLQHAIDSDDFELYYQPKIDAKTERIVGFEALIRWDDTELGVVGPGEFIEFAEETRAIIPIGKWAMRQAIEQSLRWQREGLGPIRISVNVSARQIEEGDAFAQCTRDLLKDSGLDPKLLDLEITESALLSGEDSVIELLTSLRALGVGLSLDDFGTGYSSLSYLRRLPVDTLKIDRSFVDGAEDNKERIALLGSIVSMARALNLRVVAEGIENEKQRRLLVELGCDELQGFLYSKPLNVADATALLQEQNRAGSGTWRVARITDKNTEPAESMTESQHGAVRAAVRAVKKASDSHPGDQR